MLMAHHLLFLSTRDCVQSFVCTSETKKTLVYFFPPKIFAKDETKTELEKEEEDVEWDGVPIEGAHDSEFEDDSGNNDDAFLPSATFMSMASSVASPALSVIGAGGPSSYHVFDQSRNSGKLHTLSEMEDDFDLEEIGGDPAFLDEDDDDSEFNKMKFDKDMDDDLFWDGLVDEDAHLDFD